ncbi:MAG TPA: hypothetical protein VGK48_07075, partial [Terriglobia bacterium]
MRALYSSGSRKVLRTFDRLELARDTVLYEPGKPVHSLYFPEDAVVSFWAETGAGGSIEVWTVGAEGLAGAAAVLSETSPYRGVVMVPGHAFVTTTDAFRKHLETPGRFHIELLEYCQRL